ncbi:LytTR family DNA-binding domain-containing protein [Parabacteroides sp. PF5-6]|uniref:LytR/AlgR family response regulator transcription factor n=1 Tax=Parabacteroides sp. PF5-6 TaxID=1742403 RepID=UPI002406407D|nr:LytTR family DNA-binding domain-containing protein [Parabacteroides sp. PF5-6]MDF9831400.1 two-component system response regulator LytT [Parabacteroides sp. PF5-6]
MKVLIVEDETVAYENLVEIIHGIDASIEVLGNTESINQTIDWLQNHPAPDLIFMDIHLSDGSAFAIFQYITVETPIIFTTAYDEYAIEAFKVNSVDYLLKPIKAHELERALLKLSKWTRTEVVQYLAQMTQLKPQKRFKDKLLIPVKDKLLPISLKEVSCFYTTDKNTCIYLKDGSQYSYAKTLEQILATLDPANFIRANKQFILARDSVKNITIWFDNRLLVTLDIETPERIYISKNKASEFKAWVVNSID